MRSAAFIQLPGTTVCDPLQPLNGIADLGEVFEQQIVASRYVLVEAEDETEARTLGESALRELFPELMAKTTVRSVTLATAEDIELWRWHQDFLARERDQQQGN